MPIKNYTTIVPASRSISEIQDSLVKHGADGVLYEYEQGTGRIRALKFLLEVNGVWCTFSLPVNWRLFQEVLKKQRVRRWDEEDFCYRIAWRNLRDWVMAQMALYETRMVDIPQILLPFMTNTTGVTLYEKIKENPQLLLK